LQVKLAMTIRSNYSIFALVALLASSVSSAEEPYPLEYFALREVVQNVNVSPDGERVAMLKILTRDGDPILHVYDASDMSKKPFVVNADPMEITSYNWASDRDIVVNLRQRVRDKIDGQNQGVYDYKIGVLDVVDREFEDFPVERPAFVHALPKDPDRIIISMQPGMDDIGIKEAFQPRSYYKFNLRRGSKELLMRGSFSLGAIDFDGDGVPFTARGFDRGSKEYVFYYRPKGTSEWEEVHRLHEDSHETFWISGPDEATPGNVIVGATNGDDKIGVWSYNLKNQTFDELIYRRSDVDAYGVAYHSNSWEKPDSITGITWYKDKLHTEWFDEIEGATVEQLQSLIPNSFYTTINSRSRDGSTLTAYNAGPRDPGTYFLFKDGEFKMIGSKQPLIASEDLADVEYIQYKARDGRKVGAFVTIPNGEGPFPLVVLPHGGPFILETIVYDEWSQMLANNGYMVVQPQYRGSKGYGNDFYLSAWQDGSEAGYAMQDDKDDAALYLVEKGLADPDRMAMFGWSYGGYAALVAASRDPQIYQCTIAGAAVADMIKQVATIGNEPWFRGAVEIEQMAYRHGAINPVDEVEKVNVPIMVIHGSVDQRVQPAQARLYVKQLEKHDKPYKMVWLDGADHFSNTLFYDHQLKLYESMIDFLHNDCGMATEQSGLQASAGE